MRHRDLITPHGFDDELRVVFSDSTGAWGSVCLMREPGIPRFEDSEVRFSASLAALVGEGLRRAAILGDVATADQRGAGVVVLAPDDSIETATRGAVRWLADLAAAGDTAAEIPAAVLGVAVRARRIANDYGILAGGDLVSTRAPGYAFTPHTGVG